MLWPPRLGFKQSSTPASGGANTIVTRNSICLDSFFQAVMTSKPYHGMNDRVVESRLFYRRRNEVTHASPNLMGHLGFGVNVTC